MGFWDDLAEIEWRPSPTHTSKSMGGREHFDVDAFDTTTGRKDRSQGKLHISGESHKPSMTDVHPPKKR